MADAFPSLKWLTVFRSVAQLGSVQRAAARLGLSDSTVSHQLKALEAHLGTPLVDHGRRPMVLTPAGMVYLRRVEETLRLLETARAEVTATAPSALRQLRFAMIDDFETDLGPEITRMLAAQLPGCAFTHLTRVSHEILALLDARDLDIGIATQPLTPLPGLTEIPVLRDPFVLALPAGCREAPEDVLTGATALPFLRYNRAHILGGLIEAQLVRLRLGIETHFEFDSTASILALVAQGGGWAITTPSNYARARRFEGQVTLVPFPRKSFARRISVYVANPAAEEIARTVASALRGLLTQHRIAPTVARYPWLSDGYRVVTG